jgi:hemolysin activation/secretion protein
MNTSHGGDFGFNRYVADIRRFQPLGRWDNFNVRFRVGTAEGLLPIQKRFEIGGLGTVQGYPFKEGEGNRMLLMNAEFIVNGDFLGDLSFWPSWLMRGINLLFITDAGLVRQVATSAQWTEGFEKIRFSDFKHDVGAGISTRNGSFRMALVWRTDRSEPPRFIFRFARPF